MKMIFRNKNCLAMSRVESLATICGTLLVVVLILHFGKPKTVGSQTSSRVVLREITSEATTTPESRLDSANVPVGATGFGNTNGNLEQNALTNRTRVTNDSSRAGMAGMQVPSPRKQRILIPPNARWLPTNPGVRIAFP